MPSFVSDDLSGAHAPTVLGGRYFFRMSIVEAGGPLALQQFVCTVFVDVLQSLSIGVITMPCPILFDLKSVIYKMKESYKSVANISPENCRVFANLLVITTSSQNCIATWILRKRCKFRFSCSG